MANSTVSIFFLLDFTPAEVGLIYCQQMKKLVEVMLEKTLGFGQRTVPPITDEVKDNSANNRPVSGGSGMSKGSSIFFQDDIFNPMQAIFNIAMAANA